MGMTDRITVGFDDLTLGDLEEFERMTGRNLSAMANNMDAPALRSLVYLVCRQTNPDYTLEDAGRVRFGDIDFKQQQPDPTAAAGEAGT